MESVDPVEIGRNARKFLTSPCLAELKKEFEQNGGEWKEFKIGELFSVSSNPQLNKESFHFSTNGQYPYFTRTVFNNGILGYVDYLDDEHKISGNSIAVGMLGMQFFYMPSDFYAGQFTKTVFPKFKEFNEKLAIYFIAFFNKLQKILQGVLVRDFEKIFCESKMLLPATRDGTPDFSYMERYIGELEQARVSELAAYLRAAGLENYDLTAAEQNALDDFKNGKIRFKEFKITGENGIFSVKNTHSILKNQIIPNSGNYPYVTAGETNNSILTYISYDESFLEKGNSIMIAGKSMVITYQEKNYFSNDSHNLSLSLKIESNKTYKHFLFLVSALYKSLHNKYSWGDSISKEKIKKDHLWLPVIDDKNIDYNFMESFITAQQKLAIRDVVLWKDKILSKTLEVINIDF